MTFAFLSETDATSVGANNAGLGVGGLSGYAVEIDMVKNGNDSADDLIVGELRLYVCQNHTDHGPIELPIVQHQTAFPISCIVANDGDALAVPASLIEGPDRFVGNVLFATAG